MNDSGGEGAGQKLRDAGPLISLKSHKRLPGWGEGGAAGAGACCREPLAGKEGILKGWGP